MTIPVPVPFQRDMAAAVVFFGIVALTRAGLLWGTALLCMKALPYNPWAWALSVVVVELIITGAIHADGWADAWDALFGHRTRADVLRILKDVHLGTWGGIALFTDLVARLVLTASLPPGWFTSAWTLAPLGGMMAVLWHMAWLPYARGPEGLAYGLEQSRTGVWMGLGMNGGVLIIVGSVWTVTGVGWLVIGIGLVGTAWTRYVAKRLGGYTGDTLGAAHEWGVLTTLLIWSLMVDRA